jgi:hypothetical protein
MRDGTRAGLPAITGWPRLLKAIEPSDGSAVSSGSTAARHPY